MEQSTRPRKRQGRCILWGVMIGIGVLVILNSIYVCWALYNIHRSDSLHKASTYDGNVMLTEDEAGVAKAAAKVSPSVVSVVTTEGDFLHTSQKGAGTGIVISSDGYVLTNNHVVEGADGVRIVTSEGDKYTDVAIVGRDPLNDVAFLKIKNAKNLPAAELGNSSTVKIGQKVIAIGNSLGQYQNTVTSGVISGKGRPVSASSDDGEVEEELSDLLQTDAAINLGNSGGPLINLSGQVIGINTAIVSDAQSVGFAIPINAVKGAAKSVLQGKGVQRAYIGVRYISITPEVRAEYELPVKNGAYIGGYSGEIVQKDSPADEAGIKEGDIITRVEEKIIGEDGGLSTLLSEYMPGDTVTLTILRDGKALSVRVRLAAYKS